LNSKSRKLQEYLLNGHEAKVLITLAIPVVGGIFSLFAFNLTDTYFVSRLGTNALAAMSFTFPAVIFVRGFAVGIGVAFSTLISIAIGKKDMEKVRKITTAGILLILAVSIFIAIVGVYSQDWLFTRMGATGEILELIKEYMFVWYAGVVITMYPMILGNAIAATGDTKMPSLIMLVSALINVILDPAFIFGFGAIPAMGMKGAALATVLAHLAAWVVVIYAICVKDKMVEYHIPTFANLMSRWGKMLKIAIPAGATVVLFSVSEGVVTSIIANHGEAAVAAFGAGQKLEMVAMLFAFSMGNALVPFIGQNWGANNIRRIMNAQKYGAIFVFITGIGFCILYALFAEPIARIFSSDVEVIKYIKLFLYILPTGITFHGIYHIIGISFNAIESPVKSFLLTTIKIMIFYIPFAYIGGMIIGVKGIFTGMMLANILAAIFSYTWFAKVLRDKEVEQSK
jgi:putative MATE family efflux protein